MKYAVETPTVDPTESPSEEPTEEPSEVQGLEVKWRPVAWDRLTLPLYLAHTEVSHLSRRRLKWSTVSKD